MRVWEGDDVSLNMLKISFNYMIQNIKYKVMEVHNISNSQIVWLTITLFQFFFRYQLALQMLPPKTVYFHILKVNIPNAFSKVVFNGSNIATKYVS